MSNLSTSVNVTYGPKNAIYYNAILLNKTDDPLIATFEDNRTETLIKDPQNYKLAIDRFFIPGNLIPIFYHNPTFQRFWLGMHCPTNGFKIERQITPYSDNLQDPEAVYNYRSVLKAMNDAFVDMLGGAGGWNANVPAASQIPLGPPASIPMFTFDGATGLFSLNAPLNFETDLELANVFMSHDLYLFFATLPSTVLRYKTTIEPFHDEVYLMVDYFPQNKIPYPNPDISAATFYLKIQQEANSQYAWNDLQRIFVTSSSLNTRNETLFSQSIPGTIVGRPILIDMEPIVSGDLRSNDVFQFFSQGVWKPIDINSLEPIRDIKLEFWWEDKFGNVRQIYVPPHRILDVRLVFYQWKN